jgi:hypothetical protein
MPSVSTLRNFFSQIARFIPYKHTSFCLLCSHTNESGVNVSSVSLSGCFRIVFTITEVTLIGTSIQPHSDISFVSSVQIVTVKFKTGVYFLSSSLCCAVPPGASLDRDDGNSPPRTKASIT